MKIWFTVLISVCLAQVSPADQGTQQFEPPDAQAREKAIGTTSHLPAVLKMAFRNSESFSPVTRPGPSDWLANHEEEGQTFDQYQRSRRIRPSETRYSIYIQPLGEFPESSAPDLKLLQEFAAAFFALPVKINDAVSLQELPIKHRDRDNGVRQLLSLDVLRWLETQVRPDAHCLLAVTMEDLYPEPSWNFVFGQASLVNRVGVFSFARYEPSFGGKQANQKTKPLVLQRSCKVLAHETGHMFGIKHCVHFHCLMNGSNHLAETDAKPMHLCPVCLRKLHWTGKFDVTDRYEQLQRFSDSVGWHSETEWLKKRLKLLNSSDD